MQCPICRNESYRQLFLFSETSKNQKFNLFKCSSCGLIRPNPLPYTEDTKEDIYVGEIKNTDQKTDWESKGTKQYLKNFEPYIKYIKKYRIKGKHLDIGCGAGHLLHIGQQLGLESEGVDLNKQAIRVAKNNGFKVQSKIIELLPGDTFDLITLNHVLEHIDDLKSFIGHLNRLLKDDSYLIMAFPYIYGIIPRILRTKWYGQGYGNHLNFFSIKSIKKLLNDQGFHILETKKKSLDYKQFNFIAKIFTLLGLGDNLFVVAKKS